EFAAEFLVEFAGRMVAQRQQFHRLIQRAAGVAFGAQILGLPGFKCVVDVQVRIGKGFGIEREGKLAVQKQRVTTASGLGDVGNPGHQSSTMMSRSSSLPVVFSAGAAGACAGVETFSAGLTVPFLPAAISRSALSRTCCSISAQISGLSFRNCLALSRPWPSRTSP